MNNKPDETAESDFERVFRQIIETQDPSWDGNCECKECYWNMWHPTRRSDSKQCTSETLGEVRMTPNTAACPSYWSYAVACGVEKGSTEATE